MSDESAATVPKGVPRHVITLQTIWTALGIVVGLLSIVYGFNTFLDSKIEARLKDPALLLELAKAQRPSMVFNQNGTVLSDFGAMALLRDFDIAPTEDKKAWRVTLSPREFLGVEPLVECLDKEAIIKAKRGKGLQWIVEIHPLSSLLIDDSPEPGPLRFRLEIFR
jgi:hypothetical protein